MKKAFKILGITLGIISLLLLAIPFLFQGQIKDMVKNYLNQNLNAQVEFSDVDLSFIRSFPQAYANVDDLTITNKKPFEGETLATVKSIAFTMSIKELFKTANEDAIVINSINIDEALITLKTNTLGQANYDIALQQDNNTETTKEQNDTDSSFAFDIEDYAITNSALTYIDEASKTEVFITELNHEGKGTFSAEKSELDTNTEANISLSLDSTKYLNNNHIKLEAILGLDLDNQKYTFKDNKAYINQLPLEFDGFVQLLEEGQNIDITFENPGSSFKDFLAVIPENYSKNIANVETTGNFKISGAVKGMLTEETIPTMNINIVSNNASFKYPDLPKSVENISINTSIKNTSGNADDTFVDIQTLNFKIDEDVFKSSATLRNLTQNMLVNANIDGTLNLSNITKAYPVELDNELTGTLKGNLNTNFDVNAIETNAYSRIKNNGTVSISDFVFSSEDIVNPIEITQANINFKPGTITLKNFNASTGQSDLYATGTIDNLLGFLLSDKKLQGNFNVNSNKFVVRDFMVPDEDTGEDNKTTSESESLKIPDFLDCTINADAKEVVYNNLTLKDVKGSLVIKDQQASLNNMTSRIFNGGLSINGLVDTKNDTPTFNLDLGADNFDISQSFKDLELLQALAPIANVLQGKLNSTLHLSGDLDSEFSPKLTSISGDAFAELLTKQINTENSPLLSKLENNVNFIDFKKLNLDDLKANLEFNNGHVNVKPFNLKYEDIDIQISGAHSFDKTIDYNVVFQVPAKYLGSDINRLIGKIDDQEVNNISIPVTANIGGSFTSPTVKTDLSSATTNLTNQLIEIQKQKLLNQGSNTIKDLLGGLNDNQNQDTETQTNTDSTNTNSNTVEEGVKDLIGNIFGKKKQAKDSVN
ncbi:AsmA family protein [Mangrovimonas spongiae]|uniref:AsmA family protein n=1 Tax=Mangrovimonas spongiae TaxID=2494697 RepID=A0A3R9ME07_9FLAO|nr:AsmA-like C-terminal region-containing protein [Mangrovimonas spongiae]RSK39843.1 AsmA family protein [Mangrovimonas spongiae]